ncbi:type IV secretion system protein [Helicobacter suis]|uniref:type IV secretion system protein n=1 Tax=Helicobacter suis TaxID=104628 RepID=UPI002493C36F|nr:type IV secretion system protein [Helicobacter suis]
MENSIDKNLSIYDTILSFFVSPSQKLTGDLAKSITDLFHVQLSLNIIISFLFMWWAYRRLKEGDIFQLKTLMGVLVFFVFMGVLNWAIGQPIEFMTKIREIITTPANALSNVISVAINKNIVALKNYPPSASLDKSLGTLVNSTYYTITHLYDSVFHDLGFKLFFQVFPQLIVFLLLVVAQILFLGLVLIIVLLVSVEMAIWLALGIVVLPLALFPQTKGMLFSYLKKLISLTFYQPCMTLVAFFNLQVLNFITIRIPTRNELEAGAFNGANQLLQQQNKDMGGFLDIIGYFIIIILASMICFYLVKRIPDFINNIFGTSGGVGAITEMMQKIGMTAGGVIVGGSMVMAANKMSQAYQSAGGGLAGLRAGLGALATMGATGGLSALTDKEALSSGVKFGVQSIKSAFNVGQSSHPESVSHSVSASNTKGGENTTERNDLQ